MQARRWRGTTQFAVELTEGGQRAEDYRLAQRVVCPMCEENLKEPWAKTCFTCAMELRNKRRHVMEVMEPVVGLEAQLSRFWERVAEEQVWMAEMRALVARRLAEGGDE